MVSFYPPAPGFFGANVAEDGEIIVFLITIGVCCHPIFYHAQYVFEVHNLERFVVTTRAEARF